MGIGMRNDEGETTNNNDNEKQIHLWFYASINLSTIDARISLYYGTIPTTSVHY